MYWGVGELGTKFGRFSVVRRCSGPLQCACRLCPVPVISVSVYFLRQAGSRPDPLMEVKSCPWLAWSGPGISGVQRDLVTKAGELECRCLPICLPKQNQSCFYSWVSSTCRSTKACWGDTRENRPLTAAPHYPHTLPVALSFGGLLAHPCNSHSAWLCPLLQLNR